MIRFNFLNFIFLCKEFLKWLSDHVDKPQWWSEVHSGKLKHVENVEELSLEEEK